MTRETLKHEAALRDGQPILAGRRASSAAPFAFKLLFTLVVFGLLAMLAAGTLNQFLP